MVPIHQQQHCLAWRWSHCPYRVDDVIFSVLDVSFSKAEDWLGTFLWATRYFHPVLYHIEYSINEHISEDLCDRGGIIVSDCDFIWFWQCSGHVFSYCVFNLFVLLHLIIFQSEPPGWNGALKRRHNVTCLLTYLLTYLLLNLAVHIVYIWILLHEIWFTSVQEKSHITTVSHICDFPEIAATIYTFCFHCIMLWN